MISYFILWFPMLAIAIMNGAARDLWYKKLVGELTAHQLSTVSLIILFAFYTWFVINKFTPDSGKQAICIGLLWLFLTLVFEFGFGYYRGNSWQVMLRDYNIPAGRIWVLIPVWTAIAPYLFYNLANTK